MWLQFVRGEEDLYVEIVETLGSNATRPRRFPYLRHHRATILQHWDERNLIGRDGMSKTQEEAHLQGNFARAETFPLRYGGANCEAGLTSSKKL